MSKLIDFYKDVATSLGMEISEDDFIQYGGRTLVSKSKSFTLPTKEHINSMVYENEDGEVIVSKVLYNPLNEDAIAGDSLSLTRTKLFVTTKISSFINGAGSLLLRLANVEELQKKQPLYITEFLTSLNTAKTTDKMVAVDDESIKNWEKLITKFKDNKKNYISLFLKKIGVSEGEQYNRLATLKFPVYEELVEALESKTYKVQGVTLRAKDVKVFIQIFKYLIPTLEESNKLEIGSNDNSSPAFIALMQMYLNTVATPLKVIKSLKNIDTEIYDLVYIDVPLKLKDLENLKRFKGELITIPTELDANRSKQSVIEATQAAIPAISSVENTLLPGTTTEVKTPADLLGINTVNPVSTGTSPRDLINKTLYSNNQNLALPVSTTEEPAISPLLLNQTTLENNSVLNTMSGAKSVDDVLNANSNQGLMLMQQNNNNNGLLNNNYGLGLNII